MSQRLEAHALNPTIAKCSKCNMPNDVIAGCNRISQYLLKQMGPHIIFNIKNYLSWNFKANTRKQLCQQA